MSKQLGWAVMLAVVMIAGCGQQAEKAEKSEKTETAKKIENHADEHGHVDEEHGHAAEDHAHEHEHENEHTDGQIELSPAQVIAANLEVLRATAAQINDEVELQGEIQFAPNAETVVLSPVAGVVTSAPINLGQAVKAGEVLAVLESRELAELKRSYLEARERAKLADSRLQRETQLWQEKLGTEQDYLTIKSAKAEADINLAGSRAMLLSYGLSADDLNGLSLEQPSRLARLVLRAPRQGYITTRQLALGQRVTPDTPLMTVADLRQVMAVVSATASQLAGIKVGQTVRVVQVNGQGEGTGRVQMISPQLGEASRAAAVYVTLNTTDPWRPGYFVKAKVTRAQTLATVTVSNEALQTLQNSTVVFVKEGNQFAAKAVTVGRRDASHTEILDGLAAGQAYVGKNSFLLKADLGKSEAEHDH